MEKFDLLRKTELKIDKIRLKNANLTDIAGHVADILGLNRGDVLVVDYRDEALTLDILDTCINAYHVVGKKDQLLAALSSLAGVAVSEETSVRSDGMLGWISMDQGAAQQALRRSERMAAEIFRNISKRVIVFSTGAEVAEGQVEDTNTPTIIQCLASEGYKATPGETLKDNRSLITAKLREATDSGGYGVIITTGGVGAEDKDQTVEAVKALDPEAATPYVCHYEIGTGRHAKDGIKIAVGEYNSTLIISLPGPNDEVKASLGILLEGLKSNQDKVLLAENIAANLRGILKEKTARHHGH